MVRFNYSIFNIPIENEELYTTKLQLISIFHNNPKIEESVLNEKKIINVQSNSNMDFIKHFIILKHEQCYLNDKLQNIKKILDNLINNRLNNYTEIYYDEKITADIGISAIYKIIHNTPEIYSYIYLHNSFFLCLLDTTTNFTSIIEFTKNNISDGWSPKFDIDDGFYDPWYNYVRKDELKILNQCYQSWSLENCNTLLDNLSFDNLLVHNIKCLDIQ